MYQYAAMSTEMNILNTKRAIFHMFKMSRMNPLVSERAFKFIIELKNLNICNRKKKLHNLMNKCL